MLSFQQRIRKVFICAPSTESVIRRWQFSYIKFNWPTAGETDLFDTAISNRLAVPASSGECWDDKPGYLGLRPGQLKNRTSIVGTSCVVICLSSACRFVAVCFLFFQHENVMPLAYSCFKAVNRAHVAHLCVVSGGTDLFTVKPVSEYIERGLCSLRGMNCIFMCTLNLDGVWWLMWLHCDIYVCSLVVHFCFEEYFDKRDRSDNETLS